MTKRFEIQYVINGRVMTTVLECGNQLQARQMVQSQYKCTINYVRDTK